MSLNCRKMSLSFSRLQFESKKSIESFQIAESAVSLCPMALSLARSQFEIPKQFHPIFIQCL